jgi:hypothetical protein
METWLVGLIEELNRRDRSGHQLFGGARDPFGRIRQPATRCNPVRISA